MASRSPRSVEAVASAAQLATSTGADLLTIALWVNERYRELCAKAKMRHLRRSADFLFPRTTVLTLTVVRGSERAVGDAAAIAAVWEIGEQGLKGRYLSLGSLWYEVVGLHETGLTLSRPYLGTSTAGIQGLLVPRYLALPADVRRLALITFPRLHTSLKAISSEEMSMLAPQRSVRDGGPIAWAEAFPDPETGANRVELYPYSTQDELLQLIYWAAPPHLEYDDELPAKLDLAALKEGVLVDVYRWEATQAAQRGEVERAALLRNMMEAQRTRWENIDINQAADVDKLNLSGGGLRLDLGSRYVGGDDPTMTAHDHVLLGRLGGR